MTCFNITNEQHTSARVCVHVYACARCKYRKRANTLVYSRLFVLLHIYFVYEQSVMPNIISIACKKCDCFVHWQENAILSACSRDSICISLNLNFFHAQSEDKKKKEKINQRERECYQMKLIKFEKSTFLTKNQS
uniref:Uncharacterized protein n=1 Tax=Glossina austeni TaxID=7395 RepID=A0A1A9UVU7_GLOAU